MRNPLLTLLLAAGLLTGTARLFSQSVASDAATTKDFVPVTQQMLENPSPDDWLMFNRTYDEQRFSPLTQITRQNVGTLRLVWARGMDAGLHETIPLVHQGIMYVAAPGARILALNAASGDLVWEYQRKLPDDPARRTPRTRGISIYDDMIYYAAPDGYVVAIDARTGKLRWETLAHDYRTGTDHTSGPVVIDGKVITGRACLGSPTNRAGCFIAAHDAKTGKELWKFFTTPGPGEPGGETWGNTPLDQRMASAWGLPGSYDPQRKLMYWGVANPRPHTRMKRHAGDPDGTARSAPADLYSNSTIALGLDGKLSWYYQHLPGDDWDSDFTHERMLLRTSINPDSNDVKWINPKAPRGQQRDVIVSVGEPGGLWVLDRDSGQFLWASPFPQDTPYFVVSKVDIETGKTYINWDQVIKGEGDKHIVCFQNTRTYPSIAYHPGNNSLYIPYTKLCTERAGAMKTENGATSKNIPMPGADPKTLAGIAKVNLSTGHVQQFYTAPETGTGAVLATAGDLIFYGDQNRRFRAFDSESGKILWETILAGAIENSTITYSIQGKQYVAVMTGDGSHNAPENQTAVYVFALPDGK